MFDVDVSCCLVIVLINHAHTAVTRVQDFSLHQRLEDDGGSKGSGGSISLYARQWDHSQWHEVRCAGDFWGGAPSIISVWFVVAEIWSHDSGSWRHDDDDDDDAANVDDIFGMIRIDSV